MIDELDEIMTAWDKLTNFKEIDVISILLEKLLRSGCTAIRFIRGKLPKLCIILFQVLKARS